MQNLIDLCRPTNSKFKGLPFIPKLVKAVDLFPHTNHVEVVVELRRQEEFEVMMPETRLLSCDGGEVEVEKEGQVEEKNEANGEEIANDIEIAIEA